MIEIIDSRFAIDQASHVFTSIVTIKSCVQLLALPQLSQGVCLFEISPRLSLQYFTTKASLSYCPTI